MSTGRKTDPFVTARFLGMLHHALGCPQAALLPAFRRAGLPDDAATAVDWTAPLSVMQRLLEGLADEHRMPELGVRLGAAIPPGVYALVEFIARAQPTLRDGLHVLARFAAIVNPAAEYRFEEDKAGGRFLHVVPGLSDGFGRIWNEYTVAFLLSRCELGIGDKLVPKQVWLAHPLVDARHVREALGAPVQAGVGWSGFALDKAQLAIPLRSADGPLGRFLEQQAARALEQVSARTADRVADQLRAAFPKAPSVEEVARALSLSSRSMQRQLTAEGTRFQEVRDRVRQERALLLLSQPNLTVSEIAFFTGYNTLRSFERAFAKMKGCTPTEWRKKTAAT